MNGHVDVLLGVALVILAVMVTAWMTSVPLHDASIVDVVWGAGLVVAAWTARGLGDGHAGRVDLLTVLVTIWGLRLAGHLWWRRRGAEEDFRYRSMRSRAGDAFAVKSLVTVFLFQGVLMWVVALPVQLAATPTDPGLGVLAVIGVALWGVGFFFETVGDVQLTRFRADPGNDAAVMDRGLWRYSRHPNYFGDACVWWGIWLVAAETTDARVGIVGPIVMTALLLKVTGVPMLERSLTARRPGYASYAARTSPFLPRRPKVSS